MSGLCYLAGPIDALTLDDARKAWRDGAIEYLSEHLGWATFSPAHAFTVPDRAHAVPWTCRSVVTVNDVAVQCADAVIANLSGASYGTPMECEAALRSQKPVFCFGGSARSVYRHNHVANGGCWVDTYDEALEQFEDFATRIFAPRDAFAPVQVEPPPGAMGDLGPGMSLEEAQARFG